MLLTRFDDYKRNDFNQQDESFILKEEAGEKTEYRRAISGFVTGMLDAYTLELKILSNRIVELIVSYRKDFPARGKIEGSLICKYANYGATVLTQPEWLSMCE